MKKHLNNKGYMLIEIILAAALAMGVVYFITELTIKLKNKNDDLLVKTLVSTDQAIIYNTIMKDLYNPDNRSGVCDKIKVEGNKFSYDDFSNVVTEYASLGTVVDCQDVDNKIYIKIKLGVTQLKDENFDIVINYTYD